MHGSSCPPLSIVLATHNRRPVVLRTLSELRRVERCPRSAEIIVVDNASTDGTTDAVRRMADSVIVLKHNAGSCAKAWGVDRAAGRYIVFLDDDSYPRPGSLERMLEHFERDPKLGAAGFTVHLPDGRLEGSALPDVWVGCGVGLRAAALRGVGGLDRTFFMQAEEYDLAFRLVGAGWNVRTFDDLHVEHLKSSHARRTDRTTRLDVRNNLRVAARYLPPPYSAICRTDWVQRYRWLAGRDGHEAAFNRGLWAGLVRGAWERIRYRDRRLSLGAFERCFRWEQTRGRMAELAASGLRRVAFADLGKNVFAFYQAAQSAGVGVPAIGDDRLAAPGRTYRGIPIVSLDAALSDRPDAVVVSNTARVFATTTRDRVRQRADCPVYAWFARADEETGGTKAGETGREQRPASAAPPCAPAVLSQPISSLAERGASPDGVVGSP